MADRSRSPSRGRYRSRTRSPPSRSASYSRSPTPPPRRNGRPQSDSRSWSRGRGRDSRERGESPARLKNTKIVVERLTKNINEQHLYELFGKFGHIADLDLPMNRTFNTNRGTAYILFDHEADAEEAIAALHEAQVDGATINVSIVLPQRKLSPAPPVARRGANIDPRVPFGAPRGGGPSGPAFGGGRRRASPTRYGPRSDVYRPSSRSPSRSPLGAPAGRAGPGRYRSRSIVSRSSRSRSRSPGLKRRGGGRGFDDFDQRRSRSPSRSRNHSRGQDYR